MTVVPARVAGVDRVVVASPADATGSTHPVLLAAAGLLEVDAFVVAGGAQAIGALAFGLPGRRRRTGRSDRRSRQRLGHRGQDRGLRRGRHRPAGRPVGGDGPGRAAGRRRRRRGRPHHPGRARPGFAGDPGHDGRRLRGRGRGRRHGPARARRASRHPRRRARATTAGSSSRRTWTRRSISSTPTGRSTCRSTSSRSSPRSPGSATPARLFVGPWAPESAGDYATGANHVLPTGGLARASGPLSVETYGKFSQVQRIDRDGLASIRETIGTLAGAEGLLAHRDAVEIRFDEDPVHMSPTPVTFSSPTAPASYSWEATDEQVAARYGVDPATIVRFDLNTSPTPPAIVNDLLAAGRFEASLSEYPPTDYRRLIEAAAARYGVDPSELIVGAGADEILDIVAKAFITGGGSAVVPVPTYAMYRVVTEQRGGTVVTVPRLAESAGFALDGPAIRQAVADSGATVVWLCSPNNPTALAEPDGTIAALLDGTDRRRRRGRSRATGRRPRRGLRGVRRDVADRAPRRLPEPHRGPDREQGLRAGRPADRVRRGPARDDRPAQPVPAARLHLDRLHHRRHRGAARSDGPRGEPRARRARTDAPERRAACDRLVRSGRP